VVKLQSGDEASLKAWKILCDISRKFFEKVYKRLDIVNNEYGESFYNPMIPGVLEELKEKKLAVMDDGALCLFTNKKKKGDVPLML
jgi:arginyl-tRNA synthetase